MNNHSVINVVIKTKDNFFRAGVECFFREILHSPSHPLLNFSESFSTESISQADVIIIELCRGEYFTCFPELKARTRGIVIGVTSRDAKHSTPLPSCFQDMRIYCHTDSLLAFNHLFQLTWNDRYKYQGIGIHANCASCRKKNLAPQQSLYLRHLIQGKTAADIAHTLGVSEKTVFSHKYLMMSKFNLHSDSDLMTLMYRLKDRNRINDFLGVSENTF